MLQMLRHLQTWHEDADEAYLWSSVQDLAAEELHQDLSFFELAREGHVDVEPTCGHTTRDLRMA